MKPDRETLISGGLLRPVERRREATSFVTKLYQHYCFYRRQHQTRRQLRNLSEAQLRDVGITVAQAERESKKSFWQN